MNSFDWSSRHWLPRLLMALFAVLCAECFLNLVLSHTMENSLWFTGDIHEPDPKYAFRFAPHYSGWMRFKNELFLERLELDGHGDRMPAVPRDTAREVVLIGGYSIAFSYGVPDSATIHHMIANHLAKPSLVRNTAWPGFDPYRNFHIYRDQVKGRRPADIAVILFYQDDLRSFEDIPLAQDEFIETRPKGDLFAAFQHHALAPPINSIGRLTPVLYYRSIIWHKMADRVEQLTAALPLSLNRAPLPNLADRSSPPSAMAGERLRSFTSFVCSYFGGIDHVLFVVLPGGQPQTSVDELITELPENAHLLDLNRTSNDTIAHLGTFAIGHYSAASCAYVGRQIAMAVNELP
jgi:hypothetical protein